MNDIKNRRLSAIMFTDLVGYSALMNRDESAALNVVKTNKEITTSIVDNFNGTIIKGTGDGFYIEFASAVNSVRCGIEIQKEISKHNSKTNNKDEYIILRIGIHLGDIFINDNDIFGEGVNIASRVESLADPGGICITETVYDQIKNKVEIQTFDLGTTELKSFKDKINIYKVLLEAQEKTKNSEGAKSDTNKKNNSSEAESKDKDATKVDIASSGIHVTDEDGSKVDIDSSGVHVVEKDGSKVDINISGVEIKDKDGKVYIKNNKDSKWKGYKKEISNIWKAIFKLISGIGLLIFIGGIFLDLYEFSHGLIIAMSIFIVIKVTKTYLEYNLMAAIFKLISGIVFLIFIGGIFLDLYEFWYGLVGAIAVMIVSSSLKVLFGLDDKKKEKKDKDD